MMTKKRPAASGIAGRGSNFWRTSYTPITDDTQPHARFPMCDLLGVRLVDSLPRRCPLRADWPLAIIEQLQGRAWAELGRGPDGDLAGAIDTLGRVETCTNCFARLIGHPRIQRLRPRQEDAA